MRDEIYYTGKVGHLYVSRMSLPMKTVELTVVRAERAKLTRNQAGWLTRYVPEIEIVQVVEGREFRQWLLTAEQ